MVLNGKFSILFSNLKKVVFVLIFLALAGSPVWASTIDVTFSPSPVVRNIGDQWLLDIFLTGQINASVLSQMHLDFMYDTSIISFDSADFGTWANTSWGVNSTTSFSTYPYGPVNHEAVELRVEGSLSPPPQILNNELYATVSFDAVGVGISAFEHVGSGSGGCCGGDDWPSFSVVDDGEITVLEGTPVPVPTPMLLLGSGLLGLAGFRKRCKKS